MYLKGVKIGKKKILCLAAPFLFCGLALSVGGCSLRQVAIAGAAGAFSGEAAMEVYTSDDDPELVRDAFPFALKTYEMLLAADPLNRGLYLAAAAGFVQYASAFVDDEAEMLEEADYDRSREMKARAAKLYMRGSDYAVRGLGYDHEEFRGLILENPESVLAEIVVDDAPFLFFAGAGWAGAISSEPSNMARIAELKVVEAIMRRVLELDEAFGDGAAHEFFITFEGSRSEAMGGSPERAREHYLRALEISEGGKASPHVAIATTVAVSEQDLEAFRELLGKALAVDVNEVKKWRLANILAQRKAEFLLERIPDLFVEYEEEENE